MTDESFIPEASVARVADPTAKIALLSAAESVFAAKGVEASKVEDITRKAGVSKGAFYLHFASKEDAIRQICETFLAHCANAFKAPGDVPGLPLDPSELLAFWLSTDINVFDVLWQNRSTVAILKSCQGPHHYLLQEYERTVRKTAGQWVQFWQERGLFRNEVDPNLTSEMMFGTYNQLAMKLLGETKRPPFERWLAVAQELFVRGLGTPALVAVLEARRLPRTRTYAGGASPRRRAK